MAASKACSRQSETRSLRPEAPEAREESPLSQPTTAIDAIYLQVRPVDIALVKFLFESYEEIAIVRTVDRRAALIVVLVVRDFLPVARAVLEEVRTQIAYLEVEAPVRETDDWLMREIEGED